MSRIKGRDTQPEKLVRSLLHRMGYRFRLHRKNLPGKPDIVLPRHRKIIIINGCFWHGHPDCKRSARPATNREFWNEKIDKNVARDARNLEALAELGWAVLVVWQCETKNQHMLTARLRTFLESSPAPESPECSAPGKPE